MIDLDINIPVARQCELLDIPRSTFYYQHCPESEENLNLMRAIDIEYLKHPFYGSRRMAFTLNINRKRASRLMHLMDIEAIYQKPSLSQPGKPSERFPYLLRNLAVTRPDQVWALDNVFVERLWRSVKYEEVYLHDYQSGLEAWSGLDSYFKFYCHERPHQALGYKTPASVYYSQRGDRIGASSSKIGQKFVLKP